MFDDTRSKKLIVLSHCILNQNAKLDRCAHQQGAITAVVQTLLENGIGIIQMECPELLYLGLDRETDISARPSVAEEDTRIAQRMCDPLAQGIVEAITRNVIRQIEEYRRNGFEVLGIVGINGSPTCGVETNWRDGLEPAGPGVLIAALTGQLSMLGVTIPVRGIKSANVEQAVSTVLELIE